MNRIQLLLFICLLLGFNAFYQLSSSSSQADLLNASKKREDTFRKERNKAIKELNDVKMKLQDKEEEYQLLLQQQQLLQQQLEDGTSLADCISISLSRKIGSNLPSQFPEYSQVELSLSISSSSTVSPSSFVAPFRTTYNVYSSGDIVSNEIRYNGGWDISNTRSILSKLALIPTSFNLPSSSTIPFVDIGGNVGWFVMAIGSFGYRLHAFEPMPSNILLLRKSLCDNKRTFGNRFGDVTLHEVGLGPSPASCAIVSSPHNKGNGHSFCDTPEQTWRDKFDGGRKLPGKFVFRDEYHIARLDDELPAGSSIYFMKIDIEGFEYKALFEGGARRFFTPGNLRVRYIISEVSAGKLVNLGGSAEALLTAFHNLGYQITLNDFAPNGQVLTPPAFSSTVEQLRGLFDVYLELPEELWKQD